MEKTQRQRGYLCGYNTAKEHGIEFAVQIAESFKFTDSERADGGYAYAAGYLTGLADYATVSL